MLHVSIKGHLNLISMVLTIDSQIISLIPNLFFKCNFKLLAPNRVSELTFDIYVLRTFQW
jgi:hypothetical protein